MESTEVEGHDEDIWEVPITSILEHWNPFGAWQEPAISQEEVRQAIKDNLTDQTPFSLLNFSDMSEDALREYHKRRIAWLVKNPDITPIEVDIGFPSLGVYPRNGIFDFLDGNHRLCAAIIREECSILLTYGGECDHFRQVFPSAHPHFQDRN